MSPPKSKELRPELRMLLAAVLSMAVIFLWAKFFVPKQPPLPPGQQSGATAPAQPGKPTAAATAAPSTTPSVQRGAATQPPAPTAAPAKADMQERTIVVENDLYRVEFSNRGAVVKSWKLKKYYDDAKPPKMLDLVHPDAAQQTGGWPFSLALEDAQAEAAANAALYQVAPSAAELKAPAELRFEWSDGRTDVTKTLTFDHSYVVRVETSVKQNGAPVPAAIAWRGGFGDLTVQNPGPVDRTMVFYDAAGKLQALHYKNLAGPQEPAGTAWNAGLAYAGIEDTYFAAAFLPPQGATPADLAIRYWKVERDIVVEGKPAKEPVPEMAVRRPDSSALALRVYVGPKDYDSLKKMSPPLHALVQFGDWLGLIAEPLFYLLKWLYHYIPNWGWAIVVMTLAINMLLFPLKVKSYRSMQRMQKVAPEVKQIQERYKKYSMRDPRKAEMNKEIMALYQREGINPVGGCLPMVLQMPIWFGLYRMLGVTIELRHAPWILWVHDLSAKDPTYILVIIMALTMYWMQKMTPVTTTDPTQQKMVKFMPVMFAGMFVVYPVSSGLVLYILTQNVVGIAQQWYLNRTHPAPGPPRHIGAAQRKRK